MNKIASILRLDFLPSSADLGSLVMRLWFGGSLLYLHGWGKLSDFKHMSRGFPDPLNIGHPASLTLCVLAEVLCPVLLILGLFARTAALGCAIDLGVAFVLVHKMVLKGGNSGELAFIYLAAFAALLIAGPGRFAMDGKSGGGGRSAPKKPRPSKE